MTRYRRIDPEIVEAWQYTGGGVFPEGCRDALERCGVPGDIRAGGGRTMSKVYIVQSCDYDDTTVWSVHASRDTAEAEKDRLDNEAREIVRRIAERTRERNPFRADEMLKDIEERREHYAVSEWDVQP